MKLDPQTVINLQHKLDKLKQEHKKLEDEVHELLHEPQPDDLKIHRLKKQKLAIKDQIAKIDAMLTPDIIA
jgi:hypothetical protein